MPRFIASAQGHFATLFALSDTLSLGAVTHRDRQPTILPSASQNFGDRIGIHQPLDNDATTPFSSCIESKHPRDREVMTT